MMTHTPILRLFGALALAVSLGLPQIAGAVPLGPDRPDPADLRLTVAGDCYQIGQQVARSSGGELIRAMPANKQGKAVCVVVIAVPGKDGGRPQRKQIVVDQN